MPSITWALILAASGVVQIGSVAAQSTLSTKEKPPSMPGILIDMGGHRLHFNCSGNGAPTIVVENGFEEFSFDWITVQTSLAKTNRVCTYDRAGYAWSEAGPRPRTFAQINLELHDALIQLKERAPYILVGHAFGGAIARNYALTYPGDIAGIVFVDGVSEDQRFEMWHRAVLMRDGAKGKAVPQPREFMVPDDRVEVATYYRPKRVTAVDEPFNQLPPEIQRFHLWAQSQRCLAAAEENEREWSPEYFALWHNNPSAARLGALPIIVLTREEGGFHDLDITAVQQEAERNQTQLRLASLSSRAVQVMIDSKEETEIDNPSAVVAAVRRLTEDLSTFQDERKPLP